MLQLAEGAAGRFGPAVTYAARAQPQGRPSIQFILGQQIVDACRQQTGRGGCACQVWWVGEKREAPSLVTTCRRAAATADARALSRCTHPSAPTCHKRFCISHQGSYVQVARLSRALLCCACYACCARCRCCCACCSCWLLLSGRLGGGRRAGWLRLLAGSSDGGGRPRCCQRLHSLLRSLRRPATARGGCTILRLLPL